MSGSSRGQSKSPESKLHKTTDSECAETNINGLRKNRVRNFRPSLIPQGLEEDYDVWRVRNFIQCVRNFVRISHKTAHEELRNMVPGHYLQWT